MFAVSKGRYIITSTTPGNRMYGATLFRLIRGGLQRDGYDVIGAIACDRFLCHPIYLRSGDRTGRSITHITAGQPARLAADVRSG